MRVNPTLLTANGTVAVAALRLATIQATDERTPRAGTGGPLDGPVARAGIIGVRNASRALALTRVNAVTAVGIGNG